MTNNKEDLIQELTVMIYRIQFFHAKLCGDTGNIIIDYQELRQAVLLMEELLKKLQINSI